MGGGGGGELGIKHGVRMEVIGWTNWWKKKEFFCKSKIK